MRTIRTEELRPVFAALEEALGTLGIDHYVIGAKARDAWFEKGRVRVTGTKDIDLAVMVGSEEEYRQLLEYLATKKGYTASANNEYAIISPEGHVVDLLPFGAIEIDSTVTLAAREAGEVKVNGFMEVHMEGTGALEIVDGHSFRVATLPAVILLKCIAYEDRPEMRAKDPRDIANIMMHYFELDTENIYGNHSDLYAEEAPELESDQIAATVIGREIRAILNNNDTLHQRIDNFLSTEISKVAKSKFMIEMALETGKSIEDITNLLLSVRNGLQQ